MIFYNTLPLLHYQEIVVMQFTLLLTNPSTPIPETSTLKWVLIKKIETFLFSYEADNPISIPETSRLKWKLVKKIKTFWLFANANPSVFLPIPKTIWSHSKI